MMAYPWDRPCIPAGYLKHLYQKNKWMGMELKILMINVNYFIKFYFLFFLLFFCEIQSSPMSGGGECRMMRGIVSSRI
jgi:hypothetical protein